MCDFFVHSIMSMSSTFCCDAMNVIEYDGYLTQTKLETILRDIVAMESQVEGDGWLGTELKVPTQPRRRWDMGFVLNGVTYIVEFDGDLHYRDSILMRSDEIKDDIASNCGYVTIRIPYFVQLTNETLKYFFNFGGDYDIHQSHGHGFVSTKVFPASFSEKGLRRFHSIMNTVPDGVRKDILQSLVAQSLVYGREYVFDSLTDTLCR